MKDTTTQAIRLVPGNRSDGYQRNRRPITFIAVLSAFMMILSAFPATAITPLPVSIAHAATVFPNAALLPQAPGNQAAQIVPAATPHVFAARLVPVTSGWQGQYFNNPTFTGTPAITRNDPSINFDWSNGGSPDVSISSTNFSVRWTQTISFSAGTYRFDTFSDDGARLYVDGVLVIDHLVAQSATDWQADVALASGPHTVQMDYVQYFGDAIARLQFAPVQSSIPVGDWEGDYYANTTLSGTPLLVRADPTINFNWSNGGSPTFGFPSTNFSVKWTRTLTLSGGVYRFSTSADDGARLIVDGNVVINNFVAQSLTTTNADVTLSPGNHIVEMDYVQFYGDAVASLTWAQHSVGGIVRINAGGQDYADSFNNFWNADSPISEAVTSTIPSSATFDNGITETGGLVSEQAQPIANSVDPGLNINERAGRDFSYQVPEANGNYTVRLGFVELYFNAPGVRRFNVYINSKQVLSYFDIYAQAGHAALITKSFPATVVNGVLTIHFQTVFDLAEVTAIDIYPAATLVDLTAPVFGAIPQPENASYSMPPSVTISMTDNMALNNSYWRFDNNTVQSVFTDLNATSYSASFTPNLQDFNALGVGSHTLSFGATDYNGNAWTQVWHFRKVPPGQGGAVPITFNRSTFLTSSTPGASLLKNPTSAVIGPDGKLYVSNLNGVIFKVTQDASHNIGNITPIMSLYNTPNYNVDGTAAPTVLGRHLIGFTFDPHSTPSQPIIWAATSDPRFCFNQTPLTCHINTDSGILTRLTGPNFDAAGNRTDFVTGLPRSRENHSPNSVHFGPDGWLYLADGADTNYGAPSLAFSYMPERYLTAAIMRFNVNASPQSFPIDVRTVTSAAGLIPGAFELYATGYRNAYDFVFHTNGNLYVNVNAGNYTAGNTPGPAEGCPSGQSLDPGTSPDHIDLVHQGDFGGSPNPARGQCVLDDGTSYNPALTPDPNYHANERLLYYPRNGVSPDGMVEYTAPTFGGQMVGNIISAVFAGNQSVRRVVLAPDGQSVLYDEDLGIFNQPLGVATDSSGDIYVAEFGANDVQLMQPTPSLTGQWSFGADLPVATQEVGVTACNNKMFVVDGLTGPSIDTNNLWIYSPSTNSWIAGAPYPGLAVDHVGMACLNGQVYAIGGLLHVGIAVAQVFKYDPNSDTWSAVANLPKARGAMGVAVLNGKIYVAGGVGYPDMADLTSYDPSTNAWTTLAPMLTSRDHLVLAAMNGKLFAIGGRHVTVTSMTNVNEMYDPTTNVWTQRAPAPTARGGMAVATLNGMIEVWGGEGPSGTPTNTFPEGEAYNPSTDTWITISGEPTPRHGAGAAVIGNTAYVPGGGPQTGVSVSSVNEDFTFIDSRTVLQTCALNLVIDNDGDAYASNSEVTVGDPCATALTPMENDDDDGDGIPDSQDQFQFDAHNGTATTLPWVSQWDPTNLPQGGFANSGFTGRQLSSKGGTFIPYNVHEGGAGGGLTFKATAGTAQGSSNNQDNALQIGFNATSSVTITGRVETPFSGQTVSTGKVGGIFFGLNQDNYLKLAVAGDDGNGTPGLVLGVETNGIYTQAVATDLPLPGPQTLDLILSLDPVNKRIIASYRADSDSPGSIVQIGSVDATTYPGLASLFIDGAATGIMTSNTAATSFGLGFKYFRIDPGTGATLSSPTATAVATATPTNTLLATSTPINTATSSPTNTPTGTPVATNSPVNTSTSTPSSTPTTTPLATNMPTVMPTSTSTSTPAAGGLLFTDNFEANNVGGVPTGWTVNGGSWAVIQDGSKVAAQSKPAMPAVFELSTGNPSWTNYSYSASVKLVAFSQFAGLAGRHMNAGNTYMFGLRAGSWQLSRRVGGVLKVLNQGAFTYTTGKWYKLEITLNGSSITGSVDGFVLVTATDTALTKGGIAFRSSVPSEFDNVVVTNVPSSGAKRTLRFVAGLSVPMGAATVHYGFGRRLPRPE